VGERRAAWQPGHHSNDPLRQPEPPQFEDGSPQLDGSDQTGVNVMKLLLVIRIYTGDVLLTLRHLAECQWVKCYLADA